MEGRKEGRKEGRNLVRKEVRKEERKERSKWIATAYGHYARHLILRETALSYL